MIHVLLTRTPLYSGCPFLVRLACVKRAASVDSEPGSNSRLNRLDKQGTGDRRQGTGPSAAHPEPLRSGFETQITDELLLLA